MSKPWDSEPTPMTEPYYGRWATYWHDGVSLYDHACDLERRLRNAERLLEYVRDHRLFPWDELSDRIDEHLAAARKEDGE